MTHKYKLYLLVYLIINITYLSIIGLKYATTGQFNNYSILIEILGIIIFLLLKKD